MILYTSCSQIVVPAWQYQLHLWTCKNCKFSSLTLDLWNQKPGGQGPSGCVSSGPSGDFDVWEPLVCEHHWQCQCPFPHPQNGVETVVPTSWHCSTYTSAYIAVVSVRRCVLATIAITSYPISVLHVGSAPSAALAPECPHPSFTSRFWLAT